MTPLRLERREPAHNRQRFYAIAVTRTLFDGWAVVREWGRIGQCGTVRELPDSQDCLGRLGAHSA